VGGGIWYRSLSDPLPAGISESDYRRAERTFRALHGTDPEPVDTIMTLAELALAEDRRDLALRCFAEIPSEHPQYGAPARLQEGQLLAEIGRAVEAEARLREYLQLTDNNAGLHRTHRIAARQWLRYLLSVQLRFEERKALLEEGHLRNECNIKGSNLLFFPHLVIWNTSNASEPLRQYLDQDPDNLVFRIAHARYLTWEGRQEEARRLLMEIVQRYPQDLRAQAALLECLYRSAQEEKMAGVLRSVPDYVTGEPWLLTRMRGEAAAIAGRWKVAVRYYELVLEADPTNPQCTMGLARAYGALERTDHQEAMLQRSVALADIRSYLARVEQYSPHEVRELAGKCEDLGLKKAARVYLWHADRIEQTSTHVETGRPLP
jgi:tetratricopeptide (TPR) repeat protein